MMRGRPDFAFGPRAIRLGRSRLRPGSSPRPRRPRPTRRGVVLLAVVVVVAVVLLVVAGMQGQATRTRASATTDARRVQQRLAAWAAVQAIMRDLAGERDVLLEGGDPAQPPETFDLWDDAGDVWVARVLPIGPGGARLAPEAARLDLGRITAADLVATGLVDASAADAVLAARGFVRPGAGASIIPAELAAARGVDPELVLGPLDELRIRGAASGDDGDLADRVRARLAGDAGVETLESLLTVHAIEPALQRDGVARIVLQRPWPDGLTERLDERFESGIGRLVESLVSEGLDLSNDGTLVRQLNEAGVEPPEWAPYLDALTTDPSPDHLGRLDINRAPVEALVTLPGIDEDAARLIVDTRASLGDDERWTPAWLVTQDIVSAEAYVAIHDRITTRSFTWRVRVAAGRRVAGADDDAPLRDVTVLEAVIDLGAPEPRIAELRDVSDLQLAAELLFELDAAGVRGDEAPADESGATAFGEGDDDEAGFGDEDFSPDPASAEGPPDLPDFRSEAERDPGDLPGSLESILDQVGGDGAGDSMRSEDPNRDGASDGAASGSGGGNSRPVRRRGGRWIGPG